MTSPITLPDLLEQLREPTAAYAELHAASVAQIEADQKRITALEKALDRAITWIDQEDTSGLGPAEDAAHTRIINSLDNVLHRRAGKTP